MFGVTTGSSNLRGHLVECHRDEWLKTCLDLGFTIKGKDGLVAKAEYEAELQGCYLTGPSSVPSMHHHPDFSQEGFVDALLEWIIASDQVRYILPFYVSILLSFLYSQSMLLNPFNFVNC